MTETLTGRQVLVLLAQDEAPEIEYQSKDGQWFTTTITEWFVSSLREAHCVFRIKPKPQRRLSVTPTKEAAQEHADALYKINTQEAK